MKKISKDFLMNLDKDKKKMNKSTQDKIINFRQSNNNLGK